MPDTSDVSISAPHIMNLIRAQMDGSLSTVDGTVNLDLHLVETSVFEEVETVHVCYLLLL